MKIYHPCPKCKSENTRVTCTEQKKETEIKRYIRCLDCHFRFRSVEVITDEYVNKGRVKDSFILNKHEIEQIGFNDPSLTIEQWAEIYNVSTRTINKARRIFSEGGTKEYLPKYKNALYDTTKTDFLYKAKSTVVLNSDNKRQHVYQKYSKS